MIGHLFDERREGLSLSKFGIRESAHVSVSGYTSKDSIPMCLCNMPGLVLWSGLGHVELRARAGYIGTYKG